MKAILMREAGGPEVLTEGELPLPEISAPDQVRVRIRAAGVNPVDTKLRSKGTYFPDRMPAVLGCDGAGVVDAVGDGVTRFQPGDEVYFFHGGIGYPAGNYAEYALVDEIALAKKPAAIDFVHAAAAPLVLITAWEALHDRARIQSGQSVLVHAGAGGVGHVAIQLAVEAGCRVAATVGSPEKAEFVRTLGAEPIPYREVNFVEAVLAWTGGDGVDAVLDTVGGATFEQSFAAVRPYGDIVSLLQPASEVDWKVARLRNLRVSLELMLSPPYFGWEPARRHQTGILERCTNLFDSGRLSVHVSHTLPLSKAAEAHRIIEAGGVTGKVVLTP